MSSEHKHEFEKEEEQDEKNISKLLQEPRQKYKMIDSTLTFNIPLADQNTATLVFAKTPITKRDLGRIKQWIDLITEPLLAETEEAETGDPLKGL